ncbi:MAG: hypothetical protein HYY02_09525 [Chloroflexi bacterium]|nr:hypothetical protein [Chloroflexota bacterium]
MAAARDLSSRQRPGERRTPPLKKRLLPLGFPLVAALLVALLFWPIPQSVRAGLNSWTPLSLPSNMNITGLALSPAFPCDKTVFMATDGFGVFRTTEGDVDDGVWYPVNVGMTDTSVLSLAVSPNFNRCDRGSQFNQGDSTVLVGTKSGRIFKSESGGATWVAITSGLPPATTPPNYNIAALGISPNYASDRTIFAALQSAAAGGPNGVYRSTDGGNIWLPFDAGLTDRTVQAFALSANFAHDATLFVGTRFSGVSRFAGRLSQPSLNPAAPTATPTPATSPSPVATPAIPIPTTTPGARTSAAEGARELQQIAVPYPSLRIIVTAAGAPDGQLAYTVPGPVIFNYLIINNGNEPISNIQVIDGGRHAFCGDDPSTEANEGLDDVNVGTISSLGPGQERTIAATFLVRPSSAEASGATNVTFVPRAFVGCTVGTSQSAGAVNAQDDVVVQLVVWTSITPTNSEMTDLWIWSFAVSPFFANDQTIFAGSAFGGLFKSSNGGSSAPTWVRVNGGLEPEWVSVRSIVLSPRYPNDRTLYVGTERGIHKGVERPDGSVSWTPLNRGLNRLDTRALGISPSFLQDGVLYAGVWGSDLYRLRDGSGQPTWAAQRRAVNGLWSWATGLTAEGVLLAGTWSGGPYWGGILGRNALSGTAGWEFPSLPAAPGGETTVIAVSETYCTGYIIFAGTWDRGLFQSTDGGKTWTAVAIPTNVPIRSVALSPNYAADTTLVVATWGTGVYRSNDGGATWSQLNAGLTDLLVRRVLLPPTFPTDGVIFAGTDGAGVFRWEPGQGLWSSANAGLPNSRVMGLVASPSYAADGTLAAATWGGGLAISNNRGATWRQAAAGLETPYVRVAKFSPTYQADGGIYAGTAAGLFRSSNRGASWALVGARGDDLQNVDITDMTITTGYPRTIFVSTGGKGIWSYTEANGGTSLSAVGRLMSHIDRSLPYHAFIPMAPKNRFGSMC